MLLVASMRQPQNPKSSKASGDTNSEQDICIPAFVKTNVTLNLKYKCKQTSKQFQKKYLNLSTKSTNMFVSQKKLAYFFPNFFWDEEKGARKRQFTGSLTPFPLAPFLCTTQKGLFLLLPILLFLVCRRHRDFPTPCKKYGFHHSACIRR